VACRALVAISGKFNSIRLTIVKEGLLKNVKRSMGTHLRNSSIQWGNCALLVNLSLCPEVRPLIVRQKLLDNIKGALVYHYHDQTVCNTACAVLWNLTDSEENRGPIIRAEGLLERLKMAMMGHVDDLSIQRGVCGTISNLISDNSFKSALVKEGFIAGLKAVQQAHAKDALIQEQTTKALQVLQGLLFQNLHSCFFSFHH
jgi:hypothetical protein